jgi:hypothetical protein
MAGRIASFFKEKWAAFEQAWKECGLANAVARVGIDGVFLAGELFVGAAALKGIRFAYRFTKQGRHAVDIVSIERGTVAGAEWSTGALTAKYGTPDKNIVGGKLPEPVNKVGSGPAQEPKPKPKDADDAAKMGQKTRSREELLPNGKVPEGKDFGPWWNKLTPEEHDLLWQDRRVQNTIRSRVLGSGGTHEWLKRSQLNKLKELGFSMEEIKAFTSPTKKTGGPNPLHSGERWRHGGTGSTEMHNSLDELFKNAKDRNDLLRRYGYWANSWLDNGIDSLPPALRDAILRAGGG